jgi:hypothetical protein
MYSIGFHDLYMTMRILIIFFINVPLIDEKNNFITIRTQKSISVTEFTKNPVFIPILPGTLIYSLAYPVSTACDVLDYFQSSKQNRAKCLRKYLIF